MTPGRWSIVWPSSYDDAPAFDPCYSRHHMMTPGRFGLIIISMALLELGYGGVSFVSVSNTAPKVFVAPPTYFPSQWVLWPSSSLTTPKSLSLWFSSLFAVHIGSIIVCFYNIRNTQAPPPKPIEMYFPHDVHSLLPFPPSILTPSPLCSNSFQSCLRYFFRIISVCIVDRVHFYLW